MMMPPDETETAKPPPPVIAGGGGLRGLGQRRVYGVYAPFGVRGGRIHRIHVYKGRGNPSAFAYALHQGPPFACSPAYNSICEE